MNVFNCLPIVYYSIYLTCRSFIFIFNESTKFYVKQSTLHSVVCMYAVVAAHVLYLLFEKPLILPFYLTEHKNIFLVHTTVVFQINAYN